MTERGHEAVKPKRKWGAVLVLGLLCLVLLGIGLKFGFKGFIRRQLVRAVESRFNGKMQVGHMEIYVWPTIQVTGQDLVVRLRDQTDGPPLITLETFRLQAELWDLLRPVKHVNNVRLDGLHIQIPPHDSRKQPHHKKREKLPVRFVVDHLESQDAELDMLPMNAGKPVRIFRIHQLEMSSIGLGQPASFQVILTNPKPIGQINAKGHFGPWNRDDPSRTPLSGDFTFSHADLNTIKGISGMLSSHGYFKGVLDRIETEGETDTPDFSVDISNNPVHLKTQYKAVVDGTNGNTYLNPVRAEFLHSQIVAVGGVFKSDDAPGRTVRFEFTADSAELQDLMRLAVKGSPPMTGQMNFRTKFDLPPGKQDIADRLNLDGSFRVERASFTKLDLANKVKALSRRGQGKPKQMMDGSDVFDLKGRFRLGSGVMTFSNLKFDVPGAAFQFDGSYALRSEKIHFDGTLSAPAKLSQMTTGIKSILLKAVDPFFRKNGATVLPIKVTGTRSNPSFGLDFHDKSRNKND